MCSLPFRYPLLRVRTSFMDDTLACALLSLVVALVELLLVFASCCFADHVKKIKDLKSKPNRSGPSIYDVRRPISAGFEVYLYLSGTPLSAEVMNARPLTT